MCKTTIRKDGNSAAITLSSEMLDVLGVKEGDTVYAALLSIVTASQLSVENAQDIASVVNPYRD